MWILAISVGAPATSVVVLFTQRLASRRTDALRRAGDHKAAESVDQMRFEGVSHAAVPMHDRAFDRPR
jgi:hypothetical protein